MVTAFEEGETYRNPSLPQDIMVLGIAIQTDVDVTLAILWIDRETTETTGHGELTVGLKDLTQWSPVEL